MTTEKRTKEYFEGFDAAESGLTETANPYKIGTDEAMEWNQGWLDGMGYED